MPITQQDLLPFINAGLVNQPILPDYSQIPSIPSSGGTIPGGRQSQGALGSFGNFIPGGGAINAITGGSKLGLLDPTGGLGLLGSLFGFGGGSQKPSWQPYQQNGLYYWANPAKKNPVPIANVPGANLSPSPVYTKSAQQVQALYDLMPYISGAINNTAAPTALANLQASQLTSPGYANLMTQLYNQYGPQLNAIGNEINLRNALAQANTENQVLTGPGQDLVKNAYQLSQVYDQPYYQTRQAGADAISNLINSIDLSGGLSPTERNEITQGLARQNQQAGTLFSPSQSQVVSNAMQYGQAGYQRQQQAKSNLSAAINSASAFLPASKSGVDVFQVATGRPSMPNPGNSLFPGVQQSNTSSQYGLAGNVLGNMTSIGTTYDTITANQKDWLDKFNQLASGIGSLTSSVGSIAGMAGMCWLAREVYGELSNKWKLFRRWLFEHGSSRTFSLYLKNGQNAAFLVRNNLALKQLVKNFMDNKISIYVN